jgi:hypothetical protein
MRVPIALSTPDVKRQAHVVHEARARTLHLRANVRLFSADEEKL